MNFFVFVFYDNFYFAITTVFHNSTSFDLFRDI